MNYQGININREVLSKYKDDQLKEWLKDNGREEKELPELKKQLKGSKDSSESSETN